MLIKRSISWCASNPRFWSIGYERNLRGYVHKIGAQPHKPLWQIAQYLSERGFAVLRYDKRGVGANHLNIIGNVSKSIGVLLLNGENDSQTQFNKHFSCNKD